MKPSPNHRHAARTAPRAWLPAQARLPRSLDVSHWLSRAARGHTWNGHGASKKENA